MKALLIIDSDGPNPEFNPPQPRGDDEESRAAYYEYVALVPHSISVPAGTVLDGAECWRHCLPDAEYLVRGSGDGIVRAVPYDDQCKRVVEAKVAKLHPKIRGMYERFLKKLPGLLDEIKKKQVTA